MTRALVFGGLGALGQAVVTELGATGWDVLVASRGPAESAGVDLSDPSWAANLAAEGLLDGVVWAQGTNMSGGVLAASDSDIIEVFDANVLFIAQTLRALVSADALAQPARGVVVSSIWQITARANKLAYVASKAALAGVIPAIAADMSDRRFALNGVLPGVIDTPMTRASLTAEQIDRVESDTIGGALATPEDVAHAVAWLLDPAAGGINAQWIAVDNGWSAVRSV